MGGGGRDNGDRNHRSHAGGDKENSQTDFIAHTHPIGMVGRAKKDELKADKEAAKKGRLEMVLRSNKESLLLYDREEVYNQSREQKFVDELKPRITPEILFSHFGVKEEEREGSAAVELNQAVEDEYNEAKEIHSGLKTSFFSADEYEERLAVLYQKLRNTTEIFGLRSFLMNNYPENEVIEREKKKKDDETVDFPFGDLGDDF